MNEREHDRSLALADKPALPFVRKRGFGGSLLRGVTAFDLGPLSRPRVDCDFVEMSVAGRTLEALRYSLLLLEYKVAPNGWFRAWMLLWTRLFLLMAIPTLAGVVIVQLAVPLFAGLAEVAVHAESVARSGFYALCWLVFSAMFIAAVIATARAILRRRQQTSGGARRRA